MQIEIDKTPEGLPRVAWIQMIPSSGVRKVRRNLAGWALVFGVIGLLYGWGSTHSIGDAIGYFIGGTVVGLLITFYGAGKMPQILQSIDRERRRPEMKPQYCEAYLAKFPDGSLYLRRDQYRGSLRRGAPKVAEFGIEEVKAFTVGSHRDWFGAVANMPNYDSENYPDSFVIVLQGLNGDVIKLAEHGGGKADILRLHTIMTEQFVSSIPATQATRLFGVRKQRSSRSDDLPSSL